MPPPSTGETPPGPLAPSGTVGLADEGGAKRPPPKKRHQKRLQRQCQWGDAREASKRPNQTEKAHPDGRGTGPWGAGRSTH